MKNEPLEIKFRRFEILDRADIKAKEAIMRKEDIKIFDSISVAGCPNGSVWTKDEEIGPSR